jgi:hypothetical protein
VFSPLTPARWQGFTWVFAFFMIVDTTSATAYLFAVCNAAQTIFLLYVRVVRDQHLMMTVFNIGGRRIMRHTIPTGGWVHVGGYVFNETVADRSHSQQQQSQQQPQQQPQQQSQQLQAGTASPRSAIWQPFQKQLCGFFVGHRAIYLQLRADVNLLGFCRWNAIR